MSSSIADWRRWRIDASGIVTCRWQCPRSLAAQEDIVLDGYINNIPIVSICAAELSFNAGSALNTQDSLRIAMAIFEFERNFQS